MNVALRLLFIMIAATALGQECTTTIPVSILDSDSYKLIEVDPSRLHGSVGRQAVAISNLQRIKSNRILLLVDVSKSMEKTSSFVEDITEILLRNVPAGSSLAYGFFGQKRLLSEGFSSDPGQLVTAFERLKGFTPGRGTALYDAIDEGMKLFEQPRAGDSILLISDGGENASKMAKKSLEEEIKKSGIRFFALILSKRDVRNRAEAIGPPWLFDMATETGGATPSISFSEIPWSDPKWKLEFTGFLKRFWSDAVGSGYLATVQVPPDIKTPSSWKLYLDKSQDKRLKNAILTYQRTISPCSVMAAPSH